MNKNLKKAGPIDHYDLKGNYDDDDELKKIIIIQLLKKFSFKF
jgi:hypothetical protein